MAKRLNASTATRLYCMRCGLFRTDQSLMTHARGMGTEIIMPSLVFLIEHPQGMLLFETGLAEEVASDAEGHLGELARTLRPILPPGDGIVDRLRAIGRTPHDISHVIMSCLYVDHTGGMRHFPRATFLVRARELAEARSPTPAVCAVVGNAYARKDLDRTRDFDFVALGEQDHDVFGDGAVIALNAPCHARGEQALLVRLANTGSVLLPAGVLPQEANWTEHVLTGTLVVSPDDALRSMEKLKRIAEREQALVIFHHDTQAWARCRQAPDFYD